MYSIHVRNYQCHPAMKGRQLGVILIGLLLFNVFMWIILSLASLHGEIRYILNLETETDGLVSLTASSSGLVVEQEQRRRLDLISKYCHTNTSGTALSIVIEPRSKVSYCLSRKISSTFWLQVFTYLNQKDHALSLEEYSPFNIRKLDVQLRPKLKYYGLDNDLHRRIISNTTRFMFVRDPYSRLWSVFLDKFVIMDWWFLKKFGATILKNRGMKVTHSMDFCRTEYKISFQEFLDFVVYWNKKTNGQMDDHFGTVINHCNPCKYKPHFIGKMETFERDSRDVLRLLQFEEFSDVMTATDRPLQEMHLLINYNYHMFSQKFQKCFEWCVSRMLDVFMKNGYLTNASVQRLKKRLPLSKTSLFEEVTAEYIKSNRSLRQMSAIKTKLKIQAYKKIDFKTMLEIGQIYERESLMFGYDPYPNEIFNKWNI